MKKIKFNKTSEEIGVTGYSPSPSKMSIPKWFKKMPRHIGGKMELSQDSNANNTIKACPPFLDALMAGYLIYTEYEMFVSWRQEEPYIQWKAGGDLIGTHATEQIVKEQVPEGFSEYPLKFNNYWQIQTPPGYSALFCHPLNRPDLPFQTIAGIVETDRYKLTINFPFLIKRDFEGVIPAGTPFAQIIPFKRESWQSEFGTADDSEIHKNILKLNSVIEGGYKNQWWTRKEYR